MKGTEDISGRHRTSHREGPHVSLVRHGRHPGGGGSAFRGPAETDDGPLDRDGVSPWVEVGRTGALTPSGHEECEESERPTRFVGTDFLSRRLTGGARRWKGVGPFRWSP